MDFLLEGIKAITWQQVVMYVVGIVLIYLAIKKRFRACITSSNGLWSYFG